MVSSIWLFAGPQEPAPITMLSRGMLCGAQSLQPPLAFLARDSMLSALYAIARPSVCLSVCPSVCLSVCHTGGSVKNG